MIENDLRLATLARLCRAQWRDNGLCRRIWRRIRPWALAIAAVMAVQSGTGVAVALLGTGLTTGGLLAPRMLALFAGVCFFGMLSLVFWIGMPIWYAHWSHRVTWVEDEQLRAAPMPVRDRFLAIALPGMLAMLVVHLPNLLVATWSAFFAYRNTMPYLPSSVVATVGLAAAAATTGLASAASSILLLPTAMLRFLLLDSRTGQPNGRRWPSVVRPYAMVVAIGILWGIARQIPLVAGMFAGNLGRGGVALWLFVSAFGVAGDLLSIWVYFAAMRTIWRKDIPLARTALFVVRE